MAFDKTPTVLLGAGYSADSSTLTFTIANYAELTNAEADEATGDSRKIIFALLEGIAKRFEATLVADRPSKMRLTTGTTAVNGDGIYQKSYTVSFDIKASAVEVDSEPV